jgi:hypothetical protein
MSLPDARQGRRPPLFAYHGLTSGADSKTQLPVTPEEVRHAVIGNRAMPCEGATATVMGRVPFDGSTEAEPHPV